MPVLEEYSEDSSTGVHHWIRDYQKIPRDTTSQPDAWPTAWPTLDAIYLFSWKESYARLHKGKHMMNLVNPLHRLEYSDPLRGTSQQWVEVRDLIWFESSKIFKINAYVSRPGGYKATAIQLLETLAHVTMDLFLTSRVGAGHKVVVKDENPWAIPARGWLNRRTGFSIKLALRKWWEKQRGRTRVWQPARRETPA